MSNFNECHATINTRNFVFDKSNKKNIIKNHFNRGMCKVLNRNVSQLAYRDDHNFYNAEKIIISAI